jgi:hypothetical protein
MNSSFSDSRASFVRLAILFFLMLAYPMLSMLWYHKYPIISAEVGILMSSATTIALILSWLLQRASPLIGNIVIVGGLTVVSLVQFNLEFPGMLAVFAAGMVMAVVFGKKLQILAPVVVAALVLGAWLDHFINPSTRLHELAPAEATVEKGPVIHLLMDGFIGPDGLPGDRESQLLRSQIVSFFREHDFQLNTRAYSHYTATADSMTRLFNFRNDDENIFQRASLLGEPISFSENAWFSALDQSGYQVVVYQTESLDFCQPMLERKIICNVFPMPNLRTLHRDLENPLTRAVVLLRTMGSQSRVITKTLNDARIVPLGKWGVSVFDERMMTRLSRDIMLQPANAYFAHVLVPHSPTIFREDCSVDYDSESWTRWPHWGGRVNNTPESMEVRTAKSIPQIKCSLKLLGDLFDDLKANELYDKATIIVHGDHGTSVFQTRPSARSMDKLKFHDLQQAFSTLFAVKLPGGKFSVNEEVLSLNVLMASAASEITGKSMDELGAQVTSEEEPFVYFIDVFPLRRAYVNIFDNPGVKNSTEENQVGE